MEWNRICLRPTTGKVFFKPVSCFYILCLWALIHCFLSDQWLDRQLFSSRRYSKCGISVVDQLLTAVVQKIPLSVDVRTCRSTSWRYTQRYVMKSDGFLSFFWCFCVEEGFFGCYLVLQIISTSATVEIIHLHVWRKTLRCVFLMKSLIKSFNLIIYWKHSVEKSGLAFWKTFRLDRWLFLLLLWQNFDY